MWAIIEETVNNVIDIEVSIDLSTVIFGMGVKELGLSQYIVNLFIYEAKRQVWKNRNSVRIDHRLIKSHFYQQELKKNILSFSLIRFSKYSSIKLH